MVKKQVGLFYTPIKHIFVGVLGTYVGEIVGVPRLGIPPIHIQDGPQGFRTNGKTGSPGTTTAWPSALTAVNERLKVSFSYAFSHINPDLGSVVGS